MTDTSPPPLYCANHPSVETGLRCNNCNKPICVKCAVRIPTGYRCKECVRGQQKVFETAEWYDYPLAIGIGLVLSFLGSLLAAVLGFFIIFLAAIIGIGIAEAIRFVVKRRRSPRLFLLAAAAACIGSLPLLISQGFGALLNPTIVGTLLDLLWQAFYTFTITSTVYYRLRGINIK